MTPLNRRHPHLAVKHHRKVITVLKPAAHRHLTDHQLRMLQQILGVADAQLAQVVVHRHPRLGAELLAQRALAALLLLAEFFQHKTFVQAARKPGDQLVQQRFLNGR